MFLFLLQLPFLLLCSNPDVNQQKLQLPTIEENYYQAGRIESQGNQDNALRAPVIESPDYPLYSTAPTLHQFFMLVR